MDGSNSTTRAGKGRCYCKGLLSKARPKGRPYKEMVDQAPLASTFDMKMAREHSDSFDKFYRDISWLLGT